jgi:hypothetical protein
MIVVHSFVRAELCAARGQNKASARFSVGRLDIPGEAGTVSDSEYGSEARTTMLTGREGWALENPPKYRIYRGRPHH